MSEDNEIEEVELNHCEWCGDAYNQEEAEDDGALMVGHVCMNCQEMGYKCTVCNDVFPEGDGCWIESQGAYACEPCTNRNFFWCHSCEEYIHNWSYCGCNNDEDDDEYNNDGVIKDYSYKPMPKWFVREIETNQIVITRRPDIIKMTPFMGFELEVEAGDNYRETLAEMVLKNNDDWLYCKHDGSLNDGFEIVSHPHSLAAFNLRDWSWIKQLSDKGASSWNTGTCGLHVHINKAAFKNNSHIWRFTNLVLYNRHQAARLAGRNDSQWASFYKEYKKVGKILKGDEDPNRYTAVNLVNMSTVEVRMFRGSLHEPRVRAALEFVNANFEYTKPLTSYDVLKNDAMSWWTFTAWVEQNQSTYPNLMHYLNKIKERSDRVSTLL